MKQIVSDLKKGGYLKTDRIIDAFSKIERSDFVPTELFNEAEENVALPIGYGQTISQPLVVAFMLELLEPRPGQRILDVGSGSGWTTALLSQIVGSEGKVIAIERIKELKKIGELNAEKYGFVGKGVAEFCLGDGSQGNLKSAPFDGILVSASGQEIPQALKEQLKIGGRLVMPVQSSIIFLKKTGPDNYEQQEFPGFAFVPLIK